MTKSISFNYLYFLGEEALQKFFSVKQYLAEKIKKVISQALSFLKHPYQTEEEWANQQILSNITSILDLTGMPRYLEIFQQVFQACYDQMTYNIAKYADHTIISRIEPTLQAWVNRNVHLAYSDRFERNLRQYAHDYAQYAYYQNHECASRPS